MGIEGKGCVARLIFHRLPEVFYCQFNNQMANNKSMVKYFTKCSKQAMQRRFII
jgi:hypothetical protein